MPRHDIDKSMHADARTAEILDALAAQWHCSHSEAMRRCVHMAAAHVAKTSPWIKRVLVSQRNSPQ